jgi:hypothetical protein
LHPILHPNRKASSRGCLKGVILRNSIAFGELREICFQGTADSVVIKSRSKTITLPNIEKTNHKQRHARIGRNPIGLLGRMAYGAE